MAKVVMALAAHGPSGPGRFPGAVPVSGLLPGGTSFSPGVVSMNP